MKDDRVYLLHVLGCISRIEEDTAGGKEAFFASHTVQDAVLRNLQTLAQSTQRLSEDIKARYPQIEWHRIGAFRNILVHDYLGIDMERIWEITQRDVLDLKKAVRSMPETGR